MEKIILTILVSIILQTGYGQEIKANSVITKQDYLQKSKRQRITSVVLLGGGFLITNYGGTMGGKSASRFSKVAGGILMISGFAAMCTSMPLFIISFVTKNKGMKMSVINQMIPQLQNSSFVTTPVPSLSLKINL